MVSLHPTVMLALLALPVILGAAACSVGWGFRKGWEDASEPDQVEADR